MPDRTVCGPCGQSLKSHESISVANVGVRCYRCFNEEMAVMVGIHFDGVEHTFAFRSMLVPTGHALYGRERVLNEQEGTSSRSSATSTWHLFRALYDRIRHGLAIRPVERGEFSWRITDARHLAGRITWHPERAAEVPLLVIDGRSFTWDEVGRMLMSFESFTLRAFVGGSIEVVGGPLLEKDEKA